MLKITLPGTVTVCSGFIAVSGPNAGSVFAVDKEAVANAPAPDIEKDYYQHVAEEAAALGITEVEDMVSFMQGKLTAAFARDRLIVAR